MCGSEFVCGGVHLMPGFGRWDDVVTQPLDHGPCRVGVRACSSAPFVVAKVVEDDVDDVRQQVEQLRVAGKLDRS